MTLSKSAKPVEPSLDNQTQPGILFEYPVKEQLRGFLRLEALFQQFERNRTASHRDNHLHALKLLFEILEILERGDTRAELTRELAKLSETYTQLAENPDIDDGKLKTFLKQVKQLQEWVFSYKGKFGEKLRKTPFIESVKQRTSLPGGACHFDCPDLFLFLNQPVKDKQEKLSNWVEDVKGVQTSIEVILRMLRENGKWRTEQAPMGSFLIETPDNPIQLLRIKLPADANIFPEFSCGKHCSHIHFMRFNEDNRKVPVRESIEFELACCQPL